MLTVTAIDANASGAAAFATSLGSLVGSGGATVYMTPSALYLATPQDNSSGTGSSTDTRIDRFTVEGTAVDWQAGGVVTGTLINQFAMDERDGRLRVATHTLSSQFAGGTWATVEDNGVYILDTEGDSLDLIGSVTGLAPGEQLYAVRFVEDTAYLVTFLRTDPLFAIDLSDPTAPTVEGELVIPGFSNYLQSVGDGLLLGIGQETEPGTWNTRMHVTLFDVSDSTNLIQIERQFLDEDAQWSWSESQFEHHAVLYSAGDGLLVVPVAASGYDPQSGAYRYETTLQVLTVDATGVTVRGVIHTDGIVSRTVRIGDVLYAIGEDHVTAYRLDDLSEVGRAPWEQGRGRHRRLSSSRPAVPGSGRRTGHALGGVQLLAELVHQLQLGLQVVHMLLLVGEDLLEQRRRGGVLLLAAHHDAGLQARDHLVLDGEIALELLTQRLADTQRPQPLVVRQAVEKQDAIGDPLGVNHLLQRLGASMPGQFGETPALLHLGVQKVLVDRGQFAGQLLVEQAQHIGIALQRYLLRLCGFLVEPGYCRLSRRTVSPLDTPPAVTGCRKCSPKLVFPKFAAVGIPKGSSMYVCLCTGTTSKAVIEAVAGGARTAKQVANACGAGTDCGRCCRNLKAIIDAASARG